MLTPEQSRAARGWLDWSQDDLAKRANVSLSTVRDFEKRRRMPIANNMLAIEKALTDAGVSLVSDSDGKAIGITVSVVGDPVRAFTDSGERDTGKNKGRARSRKPRRKSSRH